MVAQTGADLGSIPIALIGQDATLRPMWPLVWSVLSTPEPRVVFLETTSDSRLIRALEGKRGDSARQGSRDPTVGARREVAHRDRRFTPWTSPFHRTSCACSTGHGCDAPSRGWA